jgi:signal transduction histidine kinase
MVVAPNGAPRMSTVARPPPAATTLLSRHGSRLRDALTTPDHGGSFWVALWTACAAAQLAALWPVLLGSGATAASDTIYRALGGSFAFAGLIAWQRRPGNSVGPLMVATGSLLLAEVLLRETEPTLGLLVAGYWTIPFAVMLLVFPQGRWVARRLEPLVVGAFAAHLALQVAWVVFGQDETIRDVQTGVLLVAAVLLVIALGRRWHEASRPLRRVLVPVLAGGATMLSLAGMLAAELITGSRSQALLTITLAVLAAVPLAFLTGFLRSRLARLTVGGLVVDLRGRPSPDEVRDAIARSLRDPSAELVYWLPEFDAYADHRGREVDLPGPGGRRAVTPIDVDGRRVAALLHDPALLGERELLEAVTAAASIALENSRLNVELQARLVELRGSRARIVQAGQDERRRLERDLHDGAQQRLVALALELGLLEEELAADDHEARARLGRARDEVAASLTELRELAHGIHPAVVSAHGLEVALEQLTARAPVPTTLRVETRGRLPEPLEVAAFYLVCESLANVGKYADASSASVAIERSGGRLVVEVRDDGVGGADPERGSGLRGLADRVEALGGRLLVWSPHGGGTRVRAELPCAS